MKGNELVRELKRKFDLRTEVQLAKKLGGKQPGWNRLGRTDPVTVKMVSGIVDRAVEQNLSIYSDECVQTIVEFYPISKSDSARGANYEILDPELPGNEKLREILKNNIGIYSFYSSVGKVLYIGQTQKKRSMV